jgi:hypothetical protein
MGNLPVVEATHRMAWVPINAGQKQSFPETKASDRSLVWL